MVIGLPLSTWLQCSCMLSLTPLPALFHHWDWRSVMHLLWVTVWAQRAVVSGNSVTQTKWIMSLSFAVLWHLVKKNNESLFLQQLLKKDDNRQMSHCRKCWSQSRALEQDNYFNYLEFMMKNSSSFQEICMSLAIAWSVMTVTAKYHVPLGFSRERPRTGGLF